MTHFTDDVATHVNTDPEWLKVGSAVAALVNELSLRSDLIAKVGPTNGAEAPAFYNPALYEIEVNSSIAFGRTIPAEYVGDLRDRDVQYDWPKATGAIFHEAMHARFSRWDLRAAASDLTDAQCAALHLLEESRIEGLGRHHFPKYREFLRACALEIVLADLNVDKLAEQGQTRAAAHLAALTLARVDAGVLEADDVALAADYLNDFIGADLMDKLRGVWTEFQTLDTHTSMTGRGYELAIEWDRLVTEAATERGEEPTQAQRDAVRQMLEELAEKLADDAEATSIAAGSSLSDQQTAEEWAAEVGDRSTAAKQRNEAKAQADKTFSKGSGPGETKSGSKLLQTRKPTAVERAAAVSVAQLLEKAKYRERGELEIKSVTPPGRLRTRALVQGAALKSKGVMTQVEPWRRTVRKHTDDPDLHVGVLVDISGSMGGAMEPMATTAWVLSEAARRVQARAAMVYYGSDVFPTLKPGQHLTDVNVYTAPDGTEKFNEAFKAVDGALDLLNGTGARLLVVVSDGSYGGVGQLEAAQKWVKACDAAGVAILWITFDGGSDVRRITNGTAAEVITYAGRDASEMAKTVGAAAAKALTQVGSRV